MNDYLYNLWINSETKTDSRVKISDKVLTIFTQLKIETKTKFTDLLDTKYSDIIEIYNRPNSYVLKHFYKKGEILKYYKISTKLNMLIDEYREWIKLNYGYYGDNIFFNPINNKLYTRVWASKRISKSNELYNLLNIVDTKKKFYKLKKYKNKFNLQKTYIIKDMTNNTYKIGKSINPLQREQTLQSEKPNLKLVKIFNNDIEKELHQLYKNYRLRGEWFKLNKLQLKYICTKFK